MLTEKVYDDKKKKDKMRVLKKDGKHIYKYDAGYFNWHRNQDVGQKTDESPFIS